MRVGVGLQRRGARRKGGGGGGAARGFNIRSPDPKLDKGNALAGFNKLAQIYGESTKYAMTVVKLAYAVWAHRHQGGRGGAARELR